MTLTRPLLYSNINSHVYNDFFICWVKIVDHNLPPVLRWVPSVYGYHQVEALSKYCADSPILCAGKSNRGKDKSPSREKKLPSNTPLGVPRMLFGFVGLSSMLSRFFMENGESFAVWRVSCASESAITVHCPAWITIKRRKIFLWILVQADNKQKQKLAERKLPVMRGTSESAETSASNLRWTVMVK